MVAILKVYKIMFQDSCLQLLGFASACKIVLQALIKSIGGREPPSNGLTILFGIFIALLFQDGCLIAMWWPFWRYTKLQSKINICCFGLCQCLHFISTSIGKANSSREEPLAKVDPLGFTNACLPCFHHCFVWPHFALLSYSWTEWK